MKFIITNIGLIFCRTPLKDKAFAENEFDGIKGMSMFLKFLTSGRYSIFTNMPSLLVENFPRDVFTTLADKLTYDWEKFVRCLSVDDSAIDNLKEEFETTHEQTIQVLNQWRKDNPLKQWRDMKKALIFCKRRDLINECERSRYFGHHSFHAALVRFPRMHLKVF